MHLFFLYLFKLSVSLAVMYLFYQLLLRRLTFYNHNRWYLISYSLLCFLIPFINISPALAKNEALGHDLITFIPVLENFTGKASGTADAATGWTSWNWLVLLLLVGAMVMLIRLIAQFVSFNRIRRKAQLIADDTVRFYQVDKNIIPFSFGNSIFINQHLHTEKELKEIIRHEFVHVKQKHTIDIIWSELLCIVNWYNPFAWLIRKAIRQNLEFIADNRVLANGMDKKQYQYLLLKVIGNNHFSMANQFNFSSLKNRIIMMNKMRTAKIHLSRFLVILPLLAVVLLSFRSATLTSHTTNEPGNSPASITIADHAVMMDGAVWTDTTKPREQKKATGPAVPVTADSPAEPAHPAKPPTADAKVLIETPAQPAPDPQPTQPVQPAKPSRAPVKSKNLKEATPKPLVIVDGEEWPANLDLGLIDPAKIESMNVLKGESASAYGEKGKNAVIIITTKKANVKTVVSNSTNVIYIIDGKQSTKEAVDKLGKDQIKSVNVLKGSSAEEQYGEKGKNGVVEVTTVVGAPIK